MHDEIAVIDGEFFKPRYDTPGKDEDRLREVVAELFHAGKIKRHAGTSLDDSHVHPAFQHVLEGYFARGLYDQLEAHFTAPGYSVWPHERELAWWRKFAEAGQTQRAVRLWRTHLSGRKSDFWFRIAERKAGYIQPKYTGMSDASDRDSYNDLIAQIPRIKEDILGNMAFARHWFERMDVPEAHLRQLAADRAEIEAEERRRPTGKPDPRTMDLDVFWEVIGSPGDEGVISQIENIATRLERFKATAIKAFDKHLQELHRSTYRDDIWALAFLLNDGCSDDSFDAFRCWLILQGREAFETTLDDPNAFDINLFSTHFEGSLPLLDTSLLAFEARTGKSMARKFLTVEKLLNHELTEEAFANLLPGVAGRLGAEWN